MIAADGCLRCGREVTDRDVLWGVVRVCDACTTIGEIRERLAVERQWVAYLEQRLVEAEAEWDPLVAVVETEEER